jgi:hypothetical protein
MRTNLQKHSKAKTRNKGKKNKKQKTTPSPPKKNQKTINHVG